MILTRHAVGILVCSAYSWCMLILSFIQTSKLKEYFMFEHSSSISKAATLKYLAVVLLAWMFFVNNHPVLAQEGLSKNKEANEAMREALKVFPAELEKAAALYEKAYQHDPSLYEAALYAGNTYFMMKQYDKAGEWLAKAVALDPDRETAHRYWGGALMMQGKQDEARAKYVNAIIAEPYNQMAWNGLALWAQRNGFRLAHPRIQPPNSVKSQGNNTTLSVDPKILESSDGANHWLMYDLTRVAWSKGDFFRHFPNEKAYRHSLAEEIAALGMVADFAEKDFKAGKIKSLNPAIATLARLKNEDLLAAYVLLSKPDEGIAKDYAAYRQKNRDKLEQYINDYLIAKANPAPNPATADRTRASSNTLKSSYRQAMEYARTGKDSEAIELLKQLVATQPDFLRGYQALGHIHHKNRQFSEALAAFNKVRELNPKGFEGYIGLSTVYTSMGNREEAISMLKEAERRSPNNFSAYNSLGHAFLRVKEYQKAAELFKASIALKKDFAPAHFGLGMALAELGDGTGAMAEYNALLTLDERAAAALQRRLNSLNIPK